MNFGNLLNKYREELNLSVNKLGELANISPTYISRLQNNPQKVPSKKITLKLMKALFLQAIEQEWENIGIVNDFIIAYLFEDNKEYSSLNNEEISEYQKFMYEFFDYLEQISKSEINELYNMKEKIYENKIIMKKNVSFSTTDEETKLINQLLDKPLFDIEWYLTQNEFEILAPRNIITNNYYKDIDYNIITKKDKEIIYNLVHSYLMTKYKKTYKKNSKEFFDEVFEKSIEPINRMDWFEEE